MNYETVNIPMFYVAGLAVRTINKDGQAMKDIGALWQQFMEGRLADKLDEKEGNELYCVYTDYESDHTDYYTAILGCKVASIEYLPEGFTGKAVPAGKYAEIHPKGDFPANIGTAWQQIWDSDLNRLYSADFDVYDLKENFEESQLTIYVAID